MALSVSPGMKFGRLTVVERAPREPRFHACIAWRCICECGREHTVVGRYLIDGQSQSCGCLIRQITAHRNVTHGRSGTRTYTSWQEAKKRCLDPNSHAYPAYGAVGISICAEWRDSFEAFLRDMGERPKGTTLDRIDNRRGYEPGNCRWATPTVQSNNRLGQVRNVTHNGRTMSLAMWERELGLPKRLLSKRLFRGWSIERALTEPPRL